MCDNKIVPRLIVLRYALLPRQVLSFDYSADRDEWSFSEFYLKNISKGIGGAERLIDFASTHRDEAEYLSPLSLSKELLEFIKTLPFIDTEDFSDLERYNPFLDFPENELHEYMDGLHIPEYLDPMKNEASITETSCQEHYIWYNSIEDKSLIGLLTIFLQQLQLFASMQARGQKPS